MKLDVDERWDLVDRIAEETVNYGERETTLKDAIAEITVKPWTGIPIAITVLYGFWAFFGAFAGFFTDGFFVKIFDEHWLPWLQSAFPGKGSWYYFILVGDPAAGNSFEAFGVLTSGLFVAVGVVLPAITAFYLYLIILEDSGYMPRLAVLVDTLLHKIGLHGFAIVPMVLSLGCNVPGVAATRTLQTKKQRFMMMTLLAIFIPCGAQLGVIFSLIPQYAGMILIYLLIGFFFFGFVLHKLIPGRSPEILIDIPPYRMPSLDNVSKKLWVRTKSFFTTAIPFVLFGVALVNILYLGGVIDFLAGALGPILTNWFGVPQETIGPLIAGFLRKDLAVAQLSAIEMTKYQLISSVVLVNLYFPCIATFIMMMKEGSERGIKGVLENLGGSILVLLTVLFVWGGLLHLIWIVSGVG